MIIIMVSILRIVVSVFINMVRWLICLVSVFVIVVGNRDCICGGHAHDYAEHHRRDPAWACVQADGLTGCLDGPLTVCLFALAVCLACYGLYVAPGLAVKFVDVGETTGEMAGPGRTRSTIARCTGQHDAIGHCPIT